MTYPDPHYDEDDVCMCPDHVEQRRARQDALAETIPTIRDHVAARSSGKTLGEVMLGALLGRTTKEEDTKYGTDPRLFGYSLETREQMVKTIALSPVLEEAIYKIAELAFEDGVDSALWPAS